ncbi:MAG: cation diffusion facilitator family transporter [Bacteroidia bacterium]|nr:cation diffusion facilitator family transporter [Bacteroidia bacterium]
MQQTFSIQLKTMRWVLTGSVVILLVKFTAYFTTHSNAILSDALESIINVIAGAFAYYSLSLAAKPKDTDHPYGHGKIEFISAGFEGGLILLAGILIIVKSIGNIIHPSPIHALDTGALLAAIAGVANYFMGRVLIKLGKAHQSVILIADGKHLQSDTWSSLGLIAGVVFIYFTGLTWLDNVLAIVFACIIMFTGYQLMRKSLAGLMDEADDQILQDVLNVLNTHRKPHWIDIHNLRILQYGSSFHIDCHVTLPWYQSLQTSHDALKEMEMLIAEAFEQKVELFIHPDPCIPESCSLCSLTNCDVRQANFKNRMEWTLENVLRNQKHQL